MVDLMSSLSPELYTFHQSESGTTQIVRYICEIWGIFSDNVAIGTGKFERNSFLIAT